MPEIDNQIKSKISNPAKILRGYMDATGITDAKTLSETFGIAIRTIQRLKLECATCANDAIYGAANDAKRAIYGGPEAPNAPDMALADAPSACAGNTTGATNESPTEIVIPSKLDYPLAPKAENQASATVVELRPKTNRGSRLDRDWQLPDDWRMWARTIFPAASVEEIDSQAAQFRDYWIAKPGAQACKLDWEATWRNWCRRGLSQAGNRKPQHTGVFGRPKIDLAKLVDNSTPEWVA